MKQFKFEFTENDLTGNAGIIHFGRFLKKLNVKKILEAKISIDRASNADYQVADVVMILLLGVFAGVKHISHLAILRTDNVLRKLFKWSKFPADCTIGRIFKLFTPKTCNALSEVEDTIRRKVWGKKWFGRVTLEFDSSVKTVYGNQEGANVGYNPKRKGQKSYHPIFCFIAETRECLHNWFRDGSAYSANGIVDFAKETLARLPKRVWKIFVRADSAFFNGKFLDYLEENQCLYLIKVKLKNLNQILETQTWKKVRNQENIESCEFEYQCSDWKKVRRFLGIRQKIINKEGKIEYRHFCYVSNDNLTPWKAHKKYGKRAASENWIEWCKGQMASGSILTNNFWANSAIFQTCILSYNLFVWMMYLVYGDKLRQEPNTIRFWLIHIPARLIKRGGQFTLKLSKNNFIRKRWQDIDHFIEQISFV